MQRKHTVHPDEVSTTSPLQPFVQSLLTETGSRTGEGYVQLPIFAKCLRNKWKWKHNSFMIVLLFLMEWFLLQYCTHEIPLQNTGYTVTYKNTRKMRFPIIQRVCSAPPDVALRLGSHAGTETLSPCMGSLHHPWLTLHLRERVLAPPPPSTINWRGRPNRKKILK